VHLGRGASVLRQTHYTGDMAWYQECVAGSLVLHQELDDGVQSTILKSGEAVVNPPGVWHTIDVEAPATAFFITPSSGTEVRPR